LVDESVFDCPALLSSTRCGHIVQSVPNELILQAGERPIDRTAAVLQAGRSVDCRCVESDPQSAPGQLAPRPSGSALAEHDGGPLTGGAGLFDHSARDPIAPSAGLW